MAKVIFDKDQRAAAKRDKQFLIAIVVDGRKSVKGDGFAQVAAPVDRPTAMRVLAFLEDIAKGEVKRASKVKRKAGA